MIVFPVTYSIDAITQQNSFLLVAITNTTTSEISHEVCCYSLLSLQTVARLPVECKVTVMNAVGNLGVSSNIRYRFSTIIVFWNFYEE